MITAIITSTIIACAAYTAVYIIRKDIEGGDR